MLGNMAGKCTICSHDRGPEIDKALIAGKVPRQISAKYGLSQSAVYRHKANCISHSVEQAQIAVDTSRAVDHAANAEWALDRCKALAEENADRPDVALKAITAFLASNDQSARLTGKHPEVSPLAHPGFREMMGGLMTCLQAHPSAARDVIRYLESRRMPTFAPSEPAPPVLTVDVEVLDR